MIFPVVLTYLSKPMVKYIAIGAVVLIGVIYVQSLRLTVAHQRTEIVGLHADWASAKARVDRDAVTIRTMKKTNEENLVAIEQIEAQWRQRVEAVTADRDRIKDEKAKVKIVRQVIHEKANECVAPVPPAIGGALEWLRGNPDVAPGSFGHPGGQAGPGRGPGRAPVLRP